MKTAPFEWTARKTDARNTTVHDVERDDCSSPSRAFSVLVQRNSRRALKMTTAVVVARRDENAFADVHASVA